ncbi:MAG: glucose-6-phosphate isomerase [Bacteroidales bacterium]|nr:glucose-6-phosphate isomerase [Bacteroidales bacterium]
MENIQLNLENIFNFVSEDEFNSLKNKSLEFNNNLNNPNGKYKGYTGWADLPKKTTEDFLDKIQSVTNKLQQKVDILVVVGIGGSYLGVKAVVSALSGNFDQPKIIFAGINLSEEYLLELTEYLNDKTFGICVISKSGTTTEPAISFRVLKDLLVEKVGEQEAVNRIVAVTDKEKGALVKMSEKLGFETFVIPDDIGGRFSVLTPVGLVPIAFAGFDIKKLMSGAISMMENSSDNIPFEENLAVQYAVARNILLKKGFLIEILANYNPKLHFFAEWWKQLYGESEGKEGKGIFPASVDFTSDLHSMGQYIQDGPRFLFETIFNVKKHFDKIIINEDEENLDGLNYLKGKSLEHVNQKAMEGTLEAHLSGGVPNIIIDIPEINEFTVGQLIYFFEKACGISAMFIDVHPFVQPGVEAYKSNMFRLLGKK